MEINANVRKLKTGKRTATCEVNPQQVTDENPRSTLEKGHHRALAGGLSTFLLHTRYLFTYSQRHHRALAGGLSTFLLQSLAAVAGVSFPVAGKLRYHRLKPGGVVNNMLG